MERGNAHAEAWRRRVYDDGVLLIECCGEAMARWWHFAYVKMEVSVQLVVFG